MEPENQKKKQGKKKIPKLKNNKAEIRNSVDGF